MSDRLPRYRTRDPELDRRIDELLDAAGVAENRDQLFEILATAVRLASDDADRLDLKITNAALREIRGAFRLFAPYRHVPKVTIFGSARTRPEDPLYVQTRELARQLAGLGWMVITGAGPGIMAAGLQGAGPSNAFGVNIRLPFEQSATEFLGDDRLISMKYFFTRKLMLIKESKGFVVLPGGFGTLDEAFELFTLQQTGKAEPTPIVLLEVPGGGYWKAWQHFVLNEVAARGLIAPGDTSFYRITDNVADAAGEITGFYRNYHSLRYVGDDLVLRLNAPPTAEELTDLSRRYADVCLDGGIAATAPLPVEVRDADVVDKPRIRLAFDRVHFSRLRNLIDDVNRLASAPDPDLSPGPQPVADPPRG